MHRREGAEHRTLRFRLKKPLQQLLRKGVVATMRSHYYPPFTRVLVNGKYRAEIVDVVPATPENIARLHTMSGFNTPEEWVEAALRIHGGKLPEWILVVKLGGW